MVKQNYSLNFFQVLFIWTLFSPATDGFSAQRNDEKENCERSSFVANSVALALPALVFSATHEPSPFRAPRTGFPLTRTHVHRYFCSLNTFKPSRIDLSANSKNIHPSIAHPAYLSEERFELYFDIFSLFTCFNRCFCLKST